MDNRIVKICMSCLFVVILYFIIDAVNLFGQIGFVTDNINFDVADIVISNIVIIGLFLITYHLIDSKEIERKRNQRQTAVVLLTRTYTSCMKAIKLHDDQFVLNMTVRQCDFNTPIFEEKVLLNLQNVPFENHSFILEAAGQGVITKNELDTYLELQNAYKSYIKMKIMFFDYPEATVQEHDRLLIDLDNIIRHLKGA